LPGDDAASASSTGPLSIERFTAIHGESAPGALSDRNERTAIERRRLPTLIARVAEHAADFPDVVGGLLTYACARLQ
jgi:hypothetical protein